MQEAVLKGRTGDLDTVRELEPTLEGPGCDALVKDVGLALFAILPLSSKILLLDITQRVWPGLLVTLPTATSGAPLLTAAITALLAATAISRSPDMRLATVTAPDAMKTRSACSPRFS